MHTNKLPATSLLCASGAMGGPGWFCSSSPPSAAARWYSGRQKGPGGQHPATDSNRSGFLVVGGYNTARHSCSPLWLLRVNGTCCGERRKCAVHWGGCIWLQVFSTVTVHRKRTSIHPSFPLFFLTAKWNQRLLCTKKLWDIFAMLLSHLHWPVVYLSQSLSNKPPCSNQLLSPNFGRGTGFWKTLNGKNMEKSR